MKNVLVSCDDFAISFDRDGTPDVPISMQIRWGQRILYARMNHAGLRLFRVAFARAVEAFDPTFDDRGDR